MTDVASMPTNELTALLHAGAEGDHSRKTVVQRLTEHESWLSRPDFRDIAVRVFDGFAVVDVPAALAAIEDGRLYASSSAYTVLKLARAMNDELKLYTLDHRNAQIAARAFAVACGLTVLDLSGGS